ncbi:hypothetical protein B0H11DRAFT_2249987 [Mycena galericulata]|nr:hypothetical protein B0H11DRAFT_2264520 [Mycena galericulata]KAJ7444531.1 hypothetical protein B0H11DRAFT_2249987 [Mycena galericulata]
MPPAGKTSGGSQQGVQNKKKATRRREAARLYYARHPEAREKSRQRMAAKRLSQKLYRRQWDPPKKNKRWAKAIYFEARHEEEEQATGCPTLQEEEAVAHAALRTLTRKLQTSEAEEAGGEAEPMTLTAIEACDSSSEGSVPVVCDEEVATRRRLERQIRTLAADDVYNDSEQGSDTSVCELARRKLELKANRRARLARAQKGAEQAERELEEERQREMRWLVNSGPSAEDLYLVRGSLGVRAWLRELNEPDT